ncbi:MAG: ACP S-malonyltransferase [Candidatus Limnocylindrales bacterium]
MGSLAFVFPGQGSQYVGMGRELAQRSPAAATVFAEADAALGEALSSRIWSGEAPDLDLTINAQPALLATSIAYLRALEERLASEAARPLQPAFFAGHSMGQYSAMVAAGVLSLADGVRLVRERGRLMQQSGEGREGAMAAIIGLDDARLPELEAAGAAAGVFTIANRNSPGQVVVSGERPAVEAALAAARALGARRAVLLPVSVAAHSPLMAAAAEGMRAALAQVPFRDPIAPLVGNADARLLTTGEACRTELVDHLTAGVDWVAAARAMAEAGVTDFVEVGPGRVLTGLLKRSVPGANAVALDEADAPGRLAVPVRGAPGAAPAPPSR